MNPIGVNIHEPDTQALCPRRPNNAKSSSTSCREDQSLQAKTQIRYVSQRVCLAVRIGFWYERKEASGSREKQSAENSLCSRSGATSVSNLSASTAIGAFISYRKLYASLKMSHSGPIERGSVFCCMVCHTSGQDDHPALKYSRAVDLNAELEHKRLLVSKAYSQQPLFSVTRRQRRQKLFGAHPR